MKIEHGINLNPRHAQGKPANAADLQGLTWARLVFQFAAAGFSDLAAAYAFYDPVIERYHELGVRTLMILNQETFWGNGPWSSHDPGEWRTYANQFAGQLEQIAAHYRGKNVAYEIWNEGDTHGESSVFVKPTDYAGVLDKAAAAIRSKDPQAPIVLGGLASGTETAVQYVKEVNRALGGTSTVDRLPVDAIGVHPYGHWPPSGRPDIPTGWFGALESALNRYVSAFQGKPVWITEIGVSEPTGVGSAHWPAIAKYVEETLALVQQHYASAVPVVVWFGWSDVMRGAGIVDTHGNPKQPIYERYFQVARAAVEDQPTDAIPTATDLTPTQDALRIRRGPGQNFDIITNVDVGERLRVVEPWESARAKLGKTGRWINVQPAGHEAGWGAAWFLKLATDIPPQAPPVVTPIDDNLRVRQGPGLQFPVVTQVNAGELLAVEENWQAAVTRVGQAGQWIHIRTPQGLTGWAAAWFVRLPGAQALAAQPVAPPPPQPTGHSDANLMRALDFEREASFDRVPVCDPGAVRFFSGFGPNNYSYHTFVEGDDYYRNLLGLHNGLDFGMPVGTPMCALDWGVVMHVSQRENDNPYAAGPYSAIVRHGRYVVLYGHMMGKVQGEHVFVDKGQIVAPGQPIGLSGTSNNFPHLHFEMRNIAQAYINQLRRDAEQETQDPLGQLQHMQAHFHLRGWQPTQTYYVNPAPFFEPRLETYWQAHNWQHASLRPEDTNNNGYPDRVVRAGEQAPQDYDLYSLKSIPPAGPHFWVGSRRV